MNHVTEFKTWLEQKYLEWLSKRERKGTVREFSDLIGVDQRLMANWMNGDRKPGTDYADKISIFLNYDMTVYDLLGLPRPAKELLQLKSLWPAMTERERAEVGKLLEKIEQRNATDHKRQPLPEA